MATLWDEIKKFGPESPFDPNDPEDQKRLEFIVEYSGMPKEKVIYQLQSKGFDKFLAEFYKRHYFTNEYGWSVPTQEAVDKIKEFVGSDRILEIGSGYGMWAKLIKDAGLEIYATDTISNPEGKRYRPKEKSFMDVEDIEAVKAIQKYAGINVLMMSWPPYAEPVATLSLKAFKGNKLIFIGEGSGGCTADDDFFHILHSQWQDVGTVDIPQWEGIHDYLSLWTRK